MAGAGFADTGAQRPSRPETLYRIASITKTFTGTAIMQLRDAGQLGLDDPAVDYLPGLRGAVSPFTTTEAVTIRRMLSHESGLATEPPGTDWSVPVYQGAPEVTLAQAGDIVLKLPPNGAAQILRPRISAARRDRHQSERYPVFPVCTGADPRSARHVSDRLRAPRRAAAEPPRDWLRLAGSV